MIPTRVVSKGSVWLLDDEQKRYARMPKTEGPRLSPPGEDWGGPDAGALQDLVWHDMDLWEIIEKPIVRWEISMRPPNWEPEPIPVETDETQAVLVIYLGDSDDHVVVAPDAYVDA